ncbi:hypothetical protein LUZ60_008910 [Juncus effusus]|nr:hypothetical protein LUZ60_008910 [Juncus effusus]
MKSEPPSSPDEIIDIPSSPDELTPLQSLPSLLPGTSDFDQSDQITPPPGFPPLKPINATPISSVFQTPKNSNRAGKRKKSESDPKPINRKSKPVARSLNRDLLSSASSSNISNESKEKTEAVLLAFDALRRRLLQIADVADDVSFQKRADMKAGAIMNVNDLMANRVKRVGTIPGVEVGDIFYFRMEMCVLGLHSPVMAGIDYIKCGEHRFRGKHGSEGEHSAVSIVSSGGYENEEGSINELVYTGEGGNGSKKHDQKLVKGNLAMENSDEIDINNVTNFKYATTIKFENSHGSKKVLEGWGMRSWDPIRAGSFVCEFVGEFDGNPKFEKMEFNLNEYLFCATSVGKKALKWNRGAELALEAEGSNMNDRYESVPVSALVINAREMGNFARFLNHSCDPNLFWQLVKFGDEEGLHVMFFAIKHIPPLTELTFDYGGSTERRSKECFCGASNCRGRFG